MVATSMARLKRPALIRIPVAQRVHLAAKEGQYWGPSPASSWRAASSAATYFRASLNQRLYFPGDRSFHHLPERYEIRPVTALAWAVKLKDELKFSFDITARKHVSRFRLIRLCERV
jgi:hypothetical protein